VNLGRTPPSEQKKLVWKSKILSLLFFLFLVGCSVSTSTSKKNKDVMTVWTAINQNSNIVTLD
jgi:predicted acyltransferase